MERPTLTWPAVHVCCTPAHTLLGASSEYHPRLSLLSDGHGGGGGDTEASGPCGAPPALCPEARGTTKQAGPLSRVSLGSKETRAGKAVGPGTPPVCTGRARRSRRVGGPRQGQTQLADIPLGAWDRSPHPSPGPLPRAPQVGTELCTSLWVTSHSRPPPAPSPGPPSPRSWSSPAPAATDPLGWAQSTGAAQDGEGAPPGLPEAPSQPPDRKSVV